MKKINKDFMIQICSDSYFENLVADVYWKNHPLFMLTYDKGPDNVEIELYPPPEGMSTWVFPLKDYLSLIDSAKDYLLEPEE